MAGCISGGPPSQGSWTDRGRCGRACVQAEGQRVQQLDDEYICVTKCEGGPFYTSEANNLKVLKCNLNISLHVSGRGT